MGGQRKALIVASDEYEQDGLRNLLAPAADAEALRRVLSDPQIGEFTVQVVHNQPSHVISMQIEELFLEGRPDDVLLLHFSCHGLKSVSGELFFAARNTRPDRLGSTAIPADFVQRCMRTSRSRNVILLLDCCYGGAFAQGVSVRASGDVNVLDSFPQERLGGGRGRAVITASSAMEYAFEGTHLADVQNRRPSVFTAALVEGLASGDADLDEDGWVSVDELYDYLFERVREQNPHQTPSCHIELAGKLYLARSRRRRNRAPFIPPVPEPAAVLGPGHPDTLRTRDILARDAPEAAAGRTQYAVPLTDRERILGPDDPETLQTRESLAHATGQAGDAEAARDMYRALVADRGRILGPDHPDTLRTRDRLAFGTGQAGDAEAARDMYRALAADRGRILGPDHQDTLQSRDSLASWTGYAGGAVAARDLYRALVADYERILGPDHPDTLQSRDKAAHLTGQAGGAAAARDLYRALAADYGRILGPDHPDTLRTRDSLAHMTLRAGDTAAARDLYRALAADHERILGPDPPKTTLQSRDSLASWSNSASADPPTPTQPG